MKIIKAIGLPQTQFKIRSKGVFFSLRDIFFWFWAWKKTISKLQLMDHNNDRCALLSDYMRVILRGYVFTFLLVFMCLFLCICLPRLSTCILMYTCILMSSCVCLYFYVSVIANVMVWQSKKVCEKVHCRKVGEREGVSRTKYFLSFKKGWIWHQHFYYF